MSCCCDIVCQLNLSSIHSVPKFRDVCGKPLGLLFSGPCGLGLVGLGLGGCGIVTITVHLC